MEKFIAVPHKKYKKLITPQSSPAKTAQQNTYSATLHTLSSNKVPPAGIPPGDIRAKQAKVEERGKEASTLECR